MCAWDAGAPAPTTPCLGAHAMLLTSPPPTPTPPPPLGLQLWRGVVGAAHGEHWPPVIGVDEGALLFVCIRAAVMQSIAHLRARPGAAATVCGGSRRCGATSSTVRRPCQTHPPACTCVAVRAFLRGPAAAPRPPRRRPLIVLSPCHTKIELLAVPHLACHLIPPNPQPQPIPAPTPAVGHPLAKAVPLDGGGASAGRQAAGHPAHGAAAGQPARQRSVCTAGARGARMKLLRPSRKYNFK